MWIPKNKIMAKQFKIQFADDNYANGGVTYSEWSKDEYWQEQFNAWIEDGNVIKFEDGYSTQDAQYRNRLKNMSDLKRYFYKEFIKGQYDSYSDGGGVDDLDLTELEKNILKSLLSKLDVYDLGYSDVDANDIANDINVNINSVKGSLGSLVKKNIVFVSDLGSDIGSMIYLNDNFQYLHPDYTNKYADGGSTDDKHLVAKAIEYITGYGVDTDSVVEKDSRYNFKYKNRNVSSSLNCKLVHDTISMNKKSMASRYAKSLATKYAKGGKANTDIYDYDEKMALINLGQVYEYAIKLDKMIKDDTDLEEWVKMKLTRIEQNISDVKHSLEGWEKYKKGGEIAKKQLLHIAKYSKDLIEMIQGGSRLMSWQEDKLAVSSQSIDDIYHHLDYKMGNRAEDLDVDNEYATGGEAGFDDAGTSMVMYHEKKGNFFIPKGQVYLWLYDVEDSGEKINSEEYDYVMYPVATQSMAWQSGFIPPLKKIWTKKFQKTHKGSEHLLGVIKAYLIEEEGKKELFIDMMSVNPTKKKKGIMSYMIKDLRDTFKLTQDQVTFSGLTPEGEKFIAKKTYADGGEVNDLENYINIDKMNPNQYEIVKNYNTLKSLAKNGFIELHEKTGLRYKNYESKDKYRENRVTNVRHDYIKSATSPKFEFNNRNFAIGYIKGLNFEELYVLEDMSNK